MEAMDQNGEQRSYIMGKFQEQGAYSFLPEGELARMVDELIRLDGAYMQSAGVEDGAAYDDDAAYEALFAGMQAAFPAYRMYAMRLCEDYLDYNEAYLESTGQIEWD